MGSDLAWPALSWETHEWVSSSPDDLVSRRMRTRHAGPYHAAVPPVIAALPVTLPEAALVLAEEAAVEIARFDAEVGVDIAPFSSILLRSESTASSRIEHLTSSARSIALAELGSDLRANAAEIVGNVHAMQAALDLAHRLDEGAILAMHRALLAAHDPQEAGRWRTQQVWIGGYGYGPHEAAFVPPHHQHVPVAMADLVRFVHRDDLPVLVQAAIAHAQFETIHPFTDGNGRTGRALVHAILYGKRLTRAVTVPVSAGLLTDTDAYFDALTAYRSGDPEVIVRQVAEASFRAISNGRQLVQELREIRTSWNERIHARRDAVVWQLADVLLRQPVIDAALVQRELGATSANAHRAIRQLEAAGVITEFTDKKRNRLWQVPWVLQALDDFAERAGRRVGR
ncbi:Fic family protein [Tenggerimyces flavus]|uniref:Fic family protein n=1 Tax=Tenggerimyces flavus TaxID=1708749 RepID=A0ABV7YRJ8_9ACTN|nr:Fic family protein [Tenggerimyces flavus]MBM7784638.1 Fic family protein [Tenggerimyces flavus]